MLEQHLALALLDALQRGGQHHLGARQVKDKGDLVGAGGARDEPVVERRDGGGGQLRAGLGEGLLGDVVNESGLLFEVGEEFV